MKTKKSKRIKKRNIKRNPNSNKNVIELNSLIKTLSLNVSYLYREIGQDDTLIRFQSSWNKDFIKTSAITKRLSDFNILLESLNTSLASASNKLDNIKTNIRRYYPD